MHCERVISTWHRQCLYCIDRFPILTAFHCGTTTTPQPFYGPFSGTTGVSRCQKRTLDFMVQEKINRGRHTDHPAGRHSIQTSQRPPPPSPIVAQTHVDLPVIFQVTLAERVDSEQWLTQTYVVNHWCSVFLSHWLTVSSVLPLWDLYTASTQCWWWYISSLQRWYPVLVMMMPLLCIECE